MSDLRSRYDAACKDFDEAVDSLAAVLADLVRDEPLAMLGHLLTRYGLDRGLTCVSAS